MVSLSDQWIHKRNVINCASLVGSLWFDTIPSQLLYKTSLPGHTGSNFHNSSKGSWELGIRWMWLNSQRTLLTALTFWTHTRSFWSHTRHLHCKNTFWWVIGYCNWEYLSSFWVKPHLHWTHNAFRAFTIWRIVV